MWKNSLFEDLCCDNSMKFLTPYTKFHSKLIRRLIVGAKTKIIKGKNRHKSFWPWHKQWFLMYDTKNIRHKRKNRLDFIKIKNLNFPVQFINKSLFMQRISKAAAHIGYQLVVTLSHEETPRGRMVCTKMKHYKF